jgi:HEAT repeat protein
LAPVFLWLSRIRNETLRPLLAAAADRLAAANTAALVALINAQEPEISNEAIRRAGALKAQAAVSVLGKVIAEPDADRRLRAAQALAEIGSSGALQVLERAIGDSAREVRIIAVRTLGSHSYRPMLPRLDAAVKSPGIREADLTEKMAFFEAYGTLCGDSGVAYLDSILNGRSLFGRRDDTELRACAAISLGRIGSEAAFEALRRAAAEKDVVVRNAVSRALRGPGLQ